jgi:hypothetical protein
VPADELALYRQVYGPIPPDLKAIARARNYAPSRISIHNDLTLPEGFELSYTAEVRFRTGVHPSGGDAVGTGAVTARMNTTRQQGLVEISPYTGSVRADLLSGLLYLSEAPRV